MRILFANNFFGPFGGAENVMWDEARLLQQAGHEVHFFATRRQPYFIPDYENARFFPDYQDFRAVSRWMRLIRIPRLFYNRQAETRFNAYLRHWKPDLVHIHNLHYHLTPSILSACARQAIPAVMTLHDIRMICPSALLTENPAFRGLCNTGDPLICLRKKCKNGALSETLVSIAEYYVNRRHPLYRSVQAFITPSAALMSLIRQFGFSRPVHIDNFVDPQLLQEQRSFRDNDQDDGYFLYIGRLSPEKGLQYLLAAMAQLPEIPLKIAGTGPYESTLKQLAKEYRLTRVEFLGFQPKSAVSDLLRGCRATVLPCNWFENLPLSVIESLAFGKPVIASRVGGLPEILDHGRCGMLVSPGDTRELADALRTLFENPDIARQLGATGYERAASVYSAKRHLEQLQSLYRTVIAPGMTR